MYESDTDGLAGSCSYYKSHFSQLILYLIKFNILMGFVIRHPALRLGNGFLSNRFLHMQ